MQFNCEVVNSTIKTKKEKDYKYKVTVVTLETMNVNPEIIQLVNNEVHVTLHDVDFVAELTGVNVGIKKVNKVPFRYFRIKLEFDGTNDKISALVNKTVNAELGE